MGTGPQGFVVRALEAHHLDELAREARAGLSQFGPPQEDATPSQVVAALERSYFFLRRAKGNFARIRGDIARLGFAWGEQFVRAHGWRWQSVSLDAAPHPAVVSPCGRFAIHPAETVAQLLADDRVSTLGFAFTAVARGEPEHAQVLRLAPERA